MQVSQVAYDRFVVELPPADAEWRPLADPETISETAAWLWDFGPSPLIAIVGADAAPSWLAAWSPRQVNWGPEGSPRGFAVLLRARADLERFLAEGAPHDRTAILWPRGVEARTFEALMAGGSAWMRTVEAHARISRQGEVFEVNQVGPA